MTSSKHRGSRTRARRVAVASLFVCLGLGLVPAEAPAAEPDKSPDKSACASAYRNAQVQRKSGALRRAHGSLLVCVSDRCPAVLQPDCVRWLTEVEAAMPSLAFAAKGAEGADITDVRVSMDGELLTETLDGKSVSVDPGSHNLRFEHAGEPAIEQTVVVREGEKARVVSVSWAKAVAVVPDDSAANVSSGPPTAAWIFGGIGVASVATFGTLALLGLQRRSDLEAECFGSCEQSQVDSIKTQLAIADVALGVGVVSLGVATVLFLTHRGEGTGRAASASGQATGAARTAAAPSFTFGVAPRKNGGSVGLVGRF